MLLVECLVDCFGPVLLESQELRLPQLLLQEDAVYLQNDGETEMDVVGRVLQLTGEEREAKHTRVKEAAAQVLARNKELAQSWIEEAMKKIPR